MKEILVYECEFCNKIYRHRASAKAHENKCYANPKNKACRTCKHAIKDSETVYVRPQGDQKYGDADYDIEFIYCDITKEYLRYPDKQCRFKHDCKHYEKGKNLF